MPAFRTVSPSGAMAENIANVLGITAAQVSVKAKTNEGMGLVGAGEGPPPSPLS